MTQNKVMILILERIYLADRTLGSILKDDEVIAKTLELKWDNNKRAVSCIPEGVYTVIKQPAKADRNYPYFRLPNVPQRSGILIHRGIDINHSKGCILVASRFADIATQQPKLQESGKKLQWLIDNLDDQFQLIIRKKL